MFGTVTPMTIVYSTLFFLYGALLASFFQLVATRLPNHESMTGRSYCPTCHHPLRWIDVVPLIGYLVNRGRCHLCQAKISIAYPLIEIGGGLLFMASYWVKGFTLELVVALVMISVLMIEAICDQQTQTVLDRIWIIGLIPLVIIRIVQADFWPYLLSGTLLFATMALLAIVGKWIFKKEAFGGGDIKLYLFIGFCLTIWPGILSLFVASFFGFVYGVTRKNRSNHQIALVPFLFFGVLVAYFFGDAIIDWYLSLLGM